MRRHAVVRVGWAVVAATLVGAACGGDDDSDAEADAPVESTTTTLSVADAAAAYTEPGPYPVGITTLELDGGVQVEVWYPAVEGATGTDSYDVRELVPQTVTDLLTADVPAVYTIDASRDSDVADGQFPLVLFSHGFSSFRQQSSFLTSHLASWGMIVAAPDHWSRDLYHVLDGALGATEVDANDPVDDLRMTRELLVDESTRAGSLFEGRLDPEHTAAVGHSAGGGTVFRYALAEDVDGYVSFASGAGSAQASDSDATTEYPDEPSFFLAGRADGVVSYEDVTKVAYDGAPAPSLLWALDDAGHNAFDDVCTFGNGSGLIGVAEASGLGAFLDAQPQFRSLGEDGCLPPAVPVEQTFPVVEHSVTAWLRNVFGIDPDPVGLGPEVEDEYAVPVQVESK